MLLAPGLHAQEYVTNLLHWDVQDGLSHRQVNCICKDSRGFIWVGTRNGLCRFDGYHFVPYTKEVNGLPFNSVVKIIEDENGDLWLRGEAATNNIAIFDPLTGSAVSVKEKTGYKDDHYFAYLDKMTDGSIFAGDRKGRFYFRWNKKNGLTRINFSFADNINIVCRANNTFWVKATDDTVFYRTDAEGSILQTVVLPFRFRDIHTEIFGVGDYISSLEGERVCYVSNELNLTEITDRLPAKDFVYDFLFATGVDGILCRQGKLSHPDKGVIRDFVKEGNTSFKNSLRAALVDDTGYIWLGNDFGLYLLTVTRNKFRQYFYDSQKVIYHNSYRGLLVKDSMLYANNESNGIYAASLKTGKARSVHLADYDPSVRLFYGLARTKDNGILSASRNNIYYVPATGKINGRYRHQMLCWKICEMADDRYLLGTNEGLTWFDRRQGSFKVFTEYYFFKELALAGILDIIPDDKGRYWVCSNSGLYVYNPDKGITDRYSSRDSGSHYLPAGEFQHLYRDKDDVYWIATTTGLIKWNIEKGWYKLYNTANGLSNNNVYAVYEDNDNRLWLSSDYGIMELDKITGVVKGYFTEDGISYNEFNRISHFKDTEGRIYFGSMNGVTAFDPADFPRSVQMRSFPIVPTSYQQFNGATNRQEDKLASLIKTNTVVLHPSDRFFTIEFALLNYSNPEYTTYYWKLDGIDTGWNVQKDRVLRFSRMPYGRRVLHIKALAANGQWSRNELQIQLVVEPPVYLRLWFIIGSVALVVPGGIAWARLRTYQLKKDNEKLDRTVKEKTKALEEKTQDLEISLEQKNVLMKEIHHRVKNNLQVISSLLQIQASGVDDENAKNALIEGRNRIMSIAVIHQKLYQKDNLDSLEMSRLVTDLFLQILGLFPGIAVKFDNYIPETNISIDTAVPMGLILNELITNSFKYAFGKVEHPRITVSLEKEAGGYLLRYSDNGPGLGEGIDMEELPSLGLRLIHGLSGQIQGSVAYEYANGAAFAIRFKAQ